MARTFQITGIFAELTVRQNVHIAVESGLGFGLRAWLNRAERQRVNEAAGEVIALAGPATRRIAWWAKWPMAISARRKSRWRWRCNPA